jgi:hypothetical protein
MENYKINKSLGFVRLPFNLTLDYDDSMKDIRKDGIVKSVLDGEIQQINDYEMTAFKSQYQTIIFDIFFHKRIDIRLNKDIRTMLSTPYVDYYDKMQSKFYNLTGNTLVSEYPTFWNSFGYPFYTQKETWFEPNADGTPSSQLLSKRFDTQPYLYNSFIKMNFYTSPYAATQESLFQNVIYVNPRWCQLEGDTNGAWHRPTFRLDETTDGYYLYWLNNYNIDTFYTSFQFWDALNGRMINLLPSHPYEPNKHWVQDVNKDFDSRMLYVEYKVNYSSKKYIIRIFDPISKRWVVKPNSILLYELVFDDEFVDKNPLISISNGVPSPTTTSITTGSTVTNFDLRLTTTTTDFDLNVNSGVTPYIFNGDFEENTFQDLRSHWNTASAMVANQYEDVIKIFNDGAEPVYLKNIDIKLLNDTGSDRHSRLTGQFKSITYTNGVSQSTYILSSVPDYNLENGRQLNFESFWHPDRNQGEPENNPLYGRTVAVKDLDDNKVNSWESAAWVGWYYPLNNNNFTMWGQELGEQLRISYIGDDLSEIPANGEMNLNINWLFGGKYGYANVEPMFYQMCSNSNTFPSKNYTVNLDYEVTLYFNNLRNALPEYSNKLVFTVKPYFQFQYIKNGGSSDYKPEVERGG